MLLGAKGIATRSKDATNGAPGLTTSNKDATFGAKAIASVGIHKSPRKRSPLES